MSNLVCNVVIPARPESFNNPLFPPYVKGDERGVTRQVGVTEKRRSTEDIFMQELIIQSCKSYRSLNILRIIPRYLLIGLLLFKKGKIGGLLISSLFNSSTIC